MKLVPVALAIFYHYHNEILRVWVQTREDDGLYHGLLEFPGGGIEPDELPLAAVIREVEEEVGILVDPEAGKFMGTYANESSHRTVLLYIYLFPKLSSLENKGQWLEITSPELSSKYMGLIPAPNHKIIDDLFTSLQS